MQQSTSIHNLNADQGLSVIGKAAWVLFNSMNNSFPLFGVDDALIQSDFIVNDGVLESGVDIGRRGVSPARRLCDLFWTHLPLRSFEHELGGSIRALEVGCGSGTYGTLLNKLLDDRVCYRGVDIERHPMWDTFEGRPNYEFFKGDSADIRAYLKDVNFIFTQSALEHFGSDLTFFRQVAEYAETAVSPVIQVHLVPSANCISTFPWHGVRQYTPRNISKITKLFSASTEKHLYRLGSSRCNSLHRKWITWPRISRRADCRERDATRYENELHTAIMADMAAPTREACFYALVLKSNWTRATRDGTRSSTDAVGK